MTTFAYEHAVLCNKWPFLLHNPFTRAPNVGQSLWAWLQCYILINKRLNIHYDLIINIFIYNFNCLLHDNVLLLYSELGKMKLNIVLFPVLCNAICTVFRFILSLGSSFGNNQ